MSDPHVSVIIPTYNRKAYVQQAIDSVLAQTYPHYEIIVVDDGSADGTGEALAERYGDRIRYVWQENRGESAARNWGIQLARGVYIGFLDDDDVYLPRMMEVAVRFLEQSPDVGQVCAQCHQINAAGDIISHAVVDRFQDGYIDAEELLLKTIVLTSNSIIRRHVIDQAGHFDTAIRYGEDGDFNRRVFAVSRIYFLAEPLAALRAGIAKQSSGILDPVKAARRYADLTITLGKLDGNPLFQEYMPRLWAQVKGRYGLNLMANGQSQKAEPLLKDVFHLESTAWFYEEIMRGLFLPYLEALDDARGLDEAVSFANRLFVIALGSRAYNPQWKRRILGEFYLTRFFKCAFRGDWPGMRHAYVLAIYNKPACLQNRGMHAYVVKSVVRPASLPVNSE